MSILNVDSVSFKGIRKVVRTISPERAKIIQRSLDRKTALLFKSPQKENLLTQVINFLNGKKLVGSVYKYKDGSFDGVRTFSDGTRVTYSANKILTKKYGETVIAGAAVRGKGILSSYFPYKPYDKKGNIIVPTLREIKKYNKPENIIDLVKRGELKIIKSPVTTKI